jgi:uncharacterized protein
MNKLIIDHQEYKFLIAKICRDISLSDWKPDYVVGITRGGLSPAVMISHYFNVPCQTLKVNLRDLKEDNSCESNLWMAEDAFGYIPTDFQSDDISKTSDPTFAKNILIVDDINDTGATINWIINDWTSGCLPKDERWDYVWNKNVRFAVLVDNLSSLSTVKMDYSGVEINKTEKDIWVVFPWEEWWIK